MIKNIKKFINKKEWNTKYYEWFEFFINNGKNQKISIESLDKNKNLQLIKIPYKSSIKNKDNLKSITEKFGNKNIYFNIDPSNFLIKNNLNIIESTSYQININNFNSIEKKNIYDSLKMSINSIIPNYNLPVDMNLLLTTNILNNNKKTYLVGLKEWQNRVYISNYVSKFELINLYYDYLNLYYNYKINIKYKNINDDNSIINLILNNFQKFDYFIKKSLFNAFHLKNLIEIAKNNNEESIFIVQSDIYEKYKFILKNNLEFDNFNTELNNIKNKKFLENNIFKMAIQDIFNNTNLLNNNRLIKDNMFYLNNNQNEQMINNLYNKYYDKFNLNKEFIKKDIYSFKKVISSEEFLNLFDINKEDYEEQDSILNNEKILKLKNNIINNI